MSDTLKPKRPPPKSARPLRSRPPVRDSRADPTPRRTPVRLKADVPHARAQRESGRNDDALPARIAALETELTRLKEERGAEADELARMLVRIAEAERARIVAQERADALAERIRELEAMREEMRKGTEGIELAMRRAELAERSAADGADALARTRAELQASHARFVDLETKVARIRREHGDELASLRAARADADLRTARIVEEERSAAARAQQLAAAAEVGLNASRERIAQAASLVEEIERREEMAAALRVRALEQTRRVLQGDDAAGGGATGSTAGPADLSPSAPPPTAKRPRTSAPPDSVVEVIGLEEIESDLSEQ
jgi:hypothetical protein